MHCLVAIEGRFTHSQGAPASEHLTYERFWKRYLSAFSSVTVLGRLFPQENPKARPVEGPGVSFRALPGYTGPTEFLANYGQLRKIVREEVEAPGAAILRVPGTIGTLVWRELKRRQRPYALEVVGDPELTFGKEAVKHPLRPLLQAGFVRTLKRQAKFAVAVSYVTSRELQAKYPARGNSFAISSISLPDDWIIGPDVQRRPPGKILRVIYTASLAQPYKGVDTLLKAVALCRHAGRPIHATIVGGGRLLGEYEAMAKDLKLDGFVEFVGQINRDDVLMALDRADLYVHPSRAEGLPRALIEAMARGLPCLGSDVGGIPELLPESYLFPAGDAIAVANKIMAILDDSNEMAAASVQNRMEARKYSEAILTHLRTEFYREVREQTKLELSGGPGK